MSSPPIFSRMGSLWKDLSRITLASWNSNPGPLRPEAVTQTTIPPRSRGWSYYLQPSYGSVCTYETALEECFCSKWSRHTDCSGVRVAHITRLMDAWAYTLQAGSRLCHIRRLQKSVDRYFTSLHFKLLLFLRASIIFTNHYIHNVEGSRFSNST